MSVFSAANNTVFIKSQSVVFFHPISGHSKKLVTLMGSLRFAARNLLLNMAAPSRFITPSSLYNTYSMLAVNAGNYFCV